MAVSVKYIILMKIKISVQRPLNRTISILDKFSVCNKNSTFAMIDSNSMETTAKTQTMNYHCHVKEVNKFKTKFLLVNEYLVVILKIAYNTNGNT